MAKPRGDATFLIVDDDPVNIRQLAATLKSLGQCLFATSGAEALERALDAQPDVILLDVVMPGMDGYEVCRRLKANPATRGIPVVFISAMDEDEDEERGLRAGAIDYVAKPPRPAIVRARIANHLALKRYRDELEYLSWHDGLTRLTNRRRFDELLDQEWRRCLRNSAPLGLLILDVDHFKAFNDRFGHPAGDRCLQEVARCLAAQAKRAGDVVARFGGEEFAAILPTTDLSGAAILAERMRQAIHSMPPVLPEEGGRVTVSVGVAAALPPLVGGPADLIEAADAAVYRAKGAGRNCVKVSSPLTAAGQEVA